jgi:hypothetical protein
MKMKITEVEMSSIRPYWRNPRDNAPAVDAVVKSIEQYGFNVPIVLDKKNVIIAGHTRYKALQKMGVDKVSCIVSNMSDSKAKEFRIADNKTSELSGWDLDSLLSELKEIDDIDDMELFFPDIDLNTMISLPDGVIPDDVDISKREDELGEMFKERNEIVIGEYLELVCPECGESFTVNRHDVLTKPE